MWGSGVQVTHAAPFFLGSIPDSSGLSWPQIVDMKVEKMSGDWMFVKSPRGIACTLVISFAGSMLASCGGGSSAGSNPTPPTQQVNRPPVASASANKTLIMEGQIFELNASGSTDADGDVLTYNWEQKSGTPVQFDDATNPLQNLQSAFVDQNETLEFEVSVSDGQLVATDTVSITVNNFEAKQISSANSPFHRDLPLPGIKYLIPNSNGNLDIYWSTGFSANNHPVALQTLDIDGNTVGDQINGEFDFADFDKLNTKSVIRSGDTVYYMNEFLIRDTGERGLSTQRGTVDRTVSGFGTAYATHSGLGLFADFAAAPNDKVVSLFATSEGVTQYNTITAAIIEPDGTSITLDVAKTDQIIKENPHISVFGDGLFLAVWSEKEDGMIGRQLKMQRGSTDGLLMGERETLVEFLRGFEIATTTLSNGNILVVWDGTDDGSNIGIGAVAIGSDGSFATDVFNVNDAVAGIQSEPHAIAIGENELLITWLHQAHSTSLFELWGRVFDNEGNPLSEDFLIADSEFTANYNRPQSAVMEDGRVFLSWVNQRPRENTIFNSHLIDFYPLGK